MAKSSDRSPNPDLIFLLFVVLLLTWMLATQAGAAAAPCLLAGDSLAVGLAHYLPCRSRSRVGISTAAGAALVRPSPLVVFSGGSNDGGDWQALSRAQARAQGRFVVILPATIGRSLVATWAASQGVPAISFAPGWDHVHPLSYRALARSIRVFLR